MSDTARERELTPRARQIVGVARELLEAEGVEALSMRNIAHRLGIQAPALYRHFLDKREIELIITEQAFWEVGDHTLAAIEGADDPLGAMLRAHRDWAIANPHLYRLSFGGWLDRDRIDPASEAHAGTPVSVVTGGDADLSRAIWAFAHGMIDLELLDRFPPETDVEAVWRIGIEALRTRLAG
jgi:AcrR family transcriptional regulator